MCEACEVYSAGTHDVGLSRVGRSYPTPLVVQPVTGDASVATTKWQLASALRSPADLDTRRQWFTSSILPHREWVAGCIAEHFPDADDVEDIVQLALIRIWEGVIPEKLRFRRQYLLMTATHIAIDQLRRCANAPAVCVGDISYLAYLARREPSPTSEDLAISRDAWDRFWTVVEALPQRDGALVALRFWDGLTVPGAAECLRISVSLAEKRLRHVLPDLHSVLRASLELGEAGKRAPRGERISRASDDR